MFKLYKGFFKMNMSVVLNEAVLGALKNVSIKSDLPSQNPIM